MAIAVFVILLYLLFLMFSILVWSVQPIHTGHLHPIAVSILISARNEEHQLPFLIQSIENQQFFGVLEVVVVDDRSEDGTLGILQQWSRSSRWYVKVLQSVDASARPKKVALTLAAQHAIGDILLFTDADCTMGKKWVQSMTSHFESPRVHLLFGAIRYPNSGFLERMLSLEQAALLGSSLASLKMGIPSMCNGANMAIRKSTFYHVGGFESESFAASGDDELLLHKVYDLGSHSITFVKSKQAIVNTQPVQNLAQLFQQRRRWAGKWEKYLLMRTKLFALSIFLFHLTWIILLVGSLFKGSIACLFFLFLPLKLFLEGVFIFQVSSFLGKKINWMAFGVLQVVYSFYVVFFALVSRKKGFVWKGRSLE